MKRNIAVLSSLGILCLFILPLKASAQDACNDLTANAEWNDGIQEVTRLVQSNLYPEAQAKAKKLSYICDKSPLLHYIQGKIDEELGQKTDALLHYQKASEYTYQFAVNPDMAKKIWYARYENEHPERTAKGLEESAKQSELKLNENTSALTTQFMNDIRERNYKLMWAGAGLGIGGLVLLGTGLGLIQSTPQAADLHYNGFDLNKGGKQYTQSTNTSFVVSCALISSGAALAITGIILTGIFGYKYTHNDTQYSLSVMPNQVAFGIQF